MKLNDIYEARYSGHERGSLHWILDKFFIPSNDDNEYWVDDPYIVLFKGKQIIGVKLEINQGRNRLKLIPDAGGRAASFAAPLNMAAMVRYLHIYSSKPLI